MCVCAQAVARQGAEADGVRLGGLLTAQPQAQLDGFKSRALRSEAGAQRHLYVTQWCSLGGRSRGTEWRRKLPETTL